MSRHFYFKASCVAIATAILVSACDKPEMIVGEYTEIATGQTLDLHDIAFSDSLNGLAVGGSMWEEGVTLKTTNGGVSWQLDYQFSNKIFSVATNGQEWLCVSVPSKLHRKTSNSWEDFQGRNWDALRAAVFRNDSTLMVAGGRSFATGVLYTFNTNNRQLDSLPVGYDHEFYGIDFADNLRGVVVGYGAVYQTNDGGNTWMKSGLRDDIFTSVDLRSSGVGVMVGQFGGIYKTSNFGESWDCLKSPNGEPVFKDCLAVSDDKFLLCGDAGTIWMTENGGLSWKAFGNLPNYNYTALAFNQNKIFAVAENGKMIYIEQ